MQNIKEVIVFTDGDADKINTWSNVPYFFTSTLINRGIIVNRVNIEASGFVQKIYYKTLHIIISKFFKKTTYNYNRSIWHYKKTRKKIKESIKKYPEADLLFFLTFSNSSVGLTSKPTILFGDWPYDYYFKYFLDRKPDFFEKKSIKREKLQISKANLVFTLFPAVSDYMKKKYGNLKGIYLGNVINSLYKTSEKEILNTKRNSHKILFIGSSKYISGAVALLQAFVLLQNKNPNISLHFIGIEKTSFNNIPENVHFYGYLDKGIEKERKLYYKLLKEAHIMVNTTPKWAAFSATIEAMYFYTPVIVSYYEEFITTFGKKISFGEYCHRNTPKEILMKMEKIFLNRNYDSLCINSFLAVQEFTWENYISKMINKIEENICLNNN